MMFKSFAGLALFASGSAALAASPTTDFGLRTVGGELPSASESASTGKMSWTRLSPRFELSGVARLGSQWGRVTSTYRSPERNRRVGGVRNSFHLSGRAIDIARRPGVSHSQIAAAYRAAGYQLIESLDEGDHSHFAFGSGSRAPVAVAAAAAKRPSEVTAWRVVTAPSGFGR